MPTATASCTGLAGVSAGRCIVGVDETGRGSLFGPIVTCAVAFPASGIEPELAHCLADSKALSERRRRVIAGQLRSSVDYAFGIASAAEVDEHNPLQATMLAMTRAVTRLQASSPYVMVDGPYFPRELSEPGEALIKGDAKVPQIMAASILAKVFRDRLVARLARRFEGYGLERHAGYGTKAHFAAIIALGPSPHHRRSFLKKLPAFSSTLPACAA